MGTAETLGGAGTSGDEGGESQEMTAERTVLMPEISASAKQDVLLFLFKQMVDDATQRLQERLPHLAVMVKEMECGR